MRLLAICQMGILLDLLPFPDIFLGMKHLYRSKHNKKIAGVCGGFAEYFDLDPSLVRIVWLSSILAGGTGLILYLICWMIMPINPNVEMPVVPRPLTRSASNRILAGVCGGIGEYFQIDAVLVRIGFILLVLGIGWGILLYIILWIAIPMETTFKDNNKS